MICYVIFVMVFYLCNCMVRDVIYATLSTLCYGIFAMLSMLSFVTDVRFYYVMLSMLCNVINVMFPYVILCYLCFVM